MGVADLLYKLRIPYNSKQGYDLQSKLAEALTYYSMEESVALAKSRGAFPLCSKTEYADGKIPIAGYYEIPKDQHSYDWDALIEKIKTHGIRNVLTTTVAPTGTLSMIADCTNGMEPTFALVFEKRVTVGRFFYTNKIIEQMLKDEKVYNDEILEKIGKNSRQLWIFARYRGHSQMDAKHLRYCNGHTLVRPPDGSGRLAKMDRKRYCKDNQHAI